MTVSSVNLVFGLDWFAVLGGTVAHEVRRIARQHKATHAAQSGDGAASVGVTSLRTARSRGVMMYSAAQLVAQRYSSGTVAMVAPIGDGRWWFVAVHEGAVIARSDYVCMTSAETSDLVKQLYQAYPTLLLIDTDAQPSLSDLVAAVSPEAELRRVSYRTNFLPRPVQWFVLLIVLSFLVPRLWSVLFLSNANTRADTPAMAADIEWHSAMQTALDARWVHGVSGTSDVLNAIYDLPVALAGWHLSYVECRSEHSLWLCHADYDRNDSEASNDRFLDASREDWAVKFTPLEKVQVRWDHASKGISAAQANLKNTSANERDFFSRLQTIRSAFAHISIAAPKPLPINAPVNEQGQPIPKPSGLHEYRLRDIQIRAPLRSVSLLLPYCDAITWNKIVVGVDHRAVPDLITSRLNVTLQGVLHETE